MGSRCRSPAWSAAFALSLVVAGCGQSADTPESNASAVSSSDAGIDAGWLRGTTTVVVVSDAALVDTVDIAGLTYYVWDLTVVAEYGSPRSPLSTGIGTVRAFEFVVSQSGVDLVRGELDSGDYFFLLDENRPGGLVDATGTALSIPAIFTARGSLDSASVAFVGRPDFSEQIEEAMARAHALLAPDARSMHPATFVAELSVVASDPEVLQAVRDPAGAGELADPVAAVYRDIWLAAPEAPTPAHGAGGAHVEGEPDATIMPVLIELTGEPSTPEAADTTLVQIATELGLIEGVSGSIDRTTALVPLTDTSVLTISVVAAGENAEEVTARTAPLADLSALEGLSLQDAFESGFASALGVSIARDNGYAISEVEVLSEREYVDLLERWADSGP